jgi:O-antigen ligase
LRSLNVSWLKVLSIALVLGAWTLCSQAIYQVESLGGTGRAYGTKNPIIYGEFSTMVGALLVLRGALYRCNSRWQQIIFFGSAMAALSASYLSESRGAWIFLPVFVGLLLVIYRQYLRGRVLLGVIVLLLGLFSTLWQLDGVQKRFKRVASEISLYQTNPERLTSVGARLEMWRASLNIWQNNPLLGTGAGDYAADMKSLHEAGKLHAYHPVFNTHAHSIYFHVLAMNGLLGLTALLLTLFIIPLWLVRRTSGNHDEALFVRWGGTTVVLAGMVFGLTEHWLGWNAMTSAYLLFLLIFITTKEVRPDD